MMLWDMQATTKPIIGTPTSSYAEQEGWAALILVVAWIVLVLLRRYDAAREANWGPSEAIRFAVFLANNDPAKTKSGKLKQAQPVPAAQGGPNVIAYSGLLTGADNRASTSKATATLWTLIVVYFLITMALVLGFNYAKFQTLIGNTSPIYLVFLGGPFAAAVIAKAVVSGSLVSGDQQKSQAAAPRVADVFSDDDGNTDLVDLQYVLFNLVVAAIVLAQFLHDPGFGAPTVPSFLAGLTSASAATYVANKGLTTANSPSLDRILPASVRPGGRSVAYGSNLIASGDSSAPTVIVGGTKAPDDPTSAAGNTPPNPNLVAFQVPPGAATGQAPVRVVVVTPAPSSLEANTDNMAAANALTVVPDALVVSAARPTAARVGDAVTLYGAGFYNAVDVDADGNPIKLGANPPPPCPTTIWFHQQDPANPAVTTGNPVPCGPASGSDGQVEVTVPAGLVVGAWYNVEASRQGVARAMPNIAIQILA